VDDFLRREADIAVRMLGRCGTLAPSDIRQQTGHQRTVSATDQIAAVEGGQGIRRRGIWALRVRFDLGAPTNLPGP